jgi:hypothetical protein
VPVGQQRTAPTIARMARVIPDSLAGLTLPIAGFDTFRRTRTMALPGGLSASAGSISWQDAATGRIQLPSTEVPGWTRMSQIMKPLESGDKASQRSSRPFDAIVIALSSALLVIFGIVIGRFIVTTQAVAVVDHFDGELSALRAELVNLNRQLVQSQSRCLSLEESAEHYRGLAQQHQIRAESLAARQQTIRSMLSSRAERRSACLDQVQQYVAMNQPVPAPDVLHFAQAMFDLQDQTLDQLANTTALPSTLPNVPGFPPVAAAGQATGCSLSPTSQSLTTALPAPTTPAASITVARTAGRASEGAFFAPPQKKQPAAGTVYFPANRSAQALSMPRRAGITFHDTASEQGASVRR